MNYTKLFNNKSIIFCLFLLYLILQVPWLTDVRPVFTDESWYTNSAYNFSQNFSVQNSNVKYAGDINFIFPLIQGLFFLLFGYSLFLARFVSVIAGLFAIMLLLKILNELGISTRNSIFTVLAFIVVPNFHAVFRYARPESWAIVFVLFSLLYFVKYFKNSSLKNIFFIGLFCAFGFLTHPYVLSFAVFYGIIILFRSIKSKKIAPILIFITPILLGIILFYINFIHLYGSQNFQRILERANSVNYNYLMQIQSNLKDVYLEFFIGKRIIFSYPLTFLLLFGLFSKRKNELLFQSSLMGLSIFLISLISFSSAMFYNIIHYVFILAILNLSFIFINYKKKSVTIFISLFLLLMLGSNIYYDISKYEPINSKLVHDFNELVPKNKRVFGAIEFWLFLPNTRYISTLYYGLSEDTDFKTFPSKFDYFVIFEKDVMNKNAFIEKLNKYFLNYPSNKLIYKLYSKNYGLIKLYSL